VSSVKAILHYRASPGFLGRLAQAADAAEVSVVVVDETDREGFARELADAHVLLHLLEPVTAAHIATASQLRLIQKIGVGVNTIDLEAAKARGVLVANMPGTNSQAVAEMTLALMLAALRRLPYLDPLTRGGQGWTPDLGAVDQLGEISGKTVGFIGFGAVPSRLAPALAALGARVVYADREARHNPAAKPCSLEALLEAADVISLHVPLTSETRCLINAQTLARMKPAAVLINTARGELVDQPALVWALMSGRLRAAGLDVFDREPVDPCDPLLALPNVVLTPHMAWLTQETLDRSLAVAFENCRRLGRNEPILHRVV
jgi:phosphoglycerate dehydrogenase-like enzyme